MLRVLFAERAVLAHNESVGIVLFVLDTVVVSTLALRAFKRNFGSCRFGCHNQNSIQKITPLFGCVNKVYHTFEGLSIFFERIFNFFYFFIKIFGGDITKDAFANTSYVCECIGSHVANFYLPRKDRLFGANLF